MVSGKKWKNTTQIGGSAAGICSQNYMYGNHRQNSLLANNLADHDFESSDLFVRHMQSGHGKVYVESFGLFSPYPLESLWDRILSICLLKFFHLKRKKKVLWLAYSSWMRKNLNKQVRKKISQHCCLSLVSILFPYRNFQQPINNILLINKIGLPVCCLAWISVEFAHS